MKNFWIIILVIASVGCCSAALFSQKTITPSQPIVHKKWGSLDNYLDSLAVTRPKSYRQPKTMTIQAKPKTLLSQKATKLHIGMTRQQVTNVLGDPTWAQNYTGMPLDWTWRNGKCNPVDVTFNNRMLVAGYDEGWASCSSTTDYAVLPSDSHLCSATGNKLICAIN